MTDMFRVCVLRIFLRIDLVVISMEMFISCDIICGVYFIRFVGGTIERLSSA
jgi:hypothetical protein